MSLPDSAKELIESGALGHLVTLNPDGSPHVTCVWVGLDGDELVSGHLATGQRKLQNVKRDPRVTLSFEGTRVHPPGLKDTLYCTVGRGSRKAARRSSCSASRTSTSALT
jgi:nitroimidazol reductase NimA-like FMN-containing flavoprotein (pyridoxamine 5'-phosphate oxidase superfamily)